MIFPFYDPAVQFSTKNIKNICVYLLIIGFENVQHIE